MYTRLGDHLTQFGSNTGEKLTFFHMTDFSWSSFRTLDTTPIPEPHPVDQWAPYDFELKNENREFVDCFEKDVLTSVKHRACTEKMYVPIRGRDILPQLTFGLRACLCGHAFVCNDEVPQMHRVLETPLEDGVPFHLVMNPKCNQCSYCYRWLPVCCQRRGRSGVNTCVVCISKAHKRDEMMKDPAYLAKMRESLAKATLVPLPEDDAFQDGW